MATYGPYIFYGMCFLFILFGIAMRVYNLEYPAKEVFDEVYFPKFAGQYLRGIDVYDVHPPLGKFIIALGILGFGDTFFGWRVMPLLFGIGAIALMAWIAWKLTKSKFAALLMALFVSVDGMFIAYSRTGLMDGILVVVIFLGLLTAINLKPKSSGVVVGIALGLAVAIKWPAAAIFFPMLWYAWRAGRVKELLWSLPWAVVVYFLAVYAGEVLDGSVHPWATAINWNVNAFKYHAEITATHPWSSPWWSWPIPLKPVLFLYDTLPNNSVQMMTTLGNPLLWLSSSFAVLITSVAGVIRLVRYKVKALEHPLTPFLIGYFAFWLPWALVHRVVFLYHYFPSYVFALFMLVYWLNQFWRQSKLLVVGYTLLVVILAFYFLPWAVGWIPVTPDQLKHRVLIQSWLY
ncbi:phospholipid carrier-dependent glycosyltransferase [soil metagenome]